MLYLRHTITQGDTKISFGENQLSGGLIGLSPLPTAHPRSFQPSPVRSFTECYLRFNLAMGRSPPFGSAPRNSVAHFGLAFATPPGGFPLGSLRSSNSPAHYAKGTQSVVSTRRPTDLLPLVGTRFQVLFHSPSGVLFTFPSRYWFTIGLERVFSLTRWSSRIHAGFLGSRITWETATGEGVAFAYATFTLCGSPFQDDSANDPLCDSRTPLQRHPRSSRDPAVATLAGLHHNGLGCSAFARRYSRNRCCFLFLQVLRCFNSLGWLPKTYLIQSTDLAR